MMLLWNKQVKVFFQILLLFSSLYIIYIFFSHISWGELNNFLRGGNYIYTVWVLICSVIVYILRAYRWQLLFEHKNSLIPSKTLLLSAVSLGYMSSFFIPRSGELIRCFVLKKWGKVGMIYTAGTILVERLSDLLMLLFLIVISMFFLPENLLSFYHQFNHSSLLFNRYFFAISILVISLTGFYILYYIKIKRGFNYEIIDQLLQGITQFNKLKKKNQFILLSLGIWFCYYWMTALWFLMFDNTSATDFSILWFVFMTGNLAKILPLSAGAAGAYHLIIMGAMKLAGVDETSSIAIPVLIHGAQSIFTGIMGSLSGAWIFIQFRK